MFRPYRFVLEHARRVKPLEALMKRCKGKSRYPVFCKSLNLKQRAALLKRKMERFNSPHIYTCDASSFDGSVRNFHLDGIHSLTSKVLGSDALADKMHSWRKKNQGRSFGGIKFKIDERRMSGDSDTSFGNCLIMASAIDCVMARLGIKRYELLNDGDDCLIIVEGECLDSGMFNGFMAECGFETAAELCGTEIETAEFCRSRPVECATGLKFVNNIQRKLATFCCSHKHYRTAKEGYRVMLANALCSLSVAGDVPIMGAMAEAVRKATIRRVKQKCKKFERALFVVARENMGYRRKHKSRTHKELRVSIESSARFVKPTIESRNSFYLAFGITPQDQVRVEDYWMSLKESDLSLGSWHYEECHTIDSVFIEQRTLLHAPTVVVY
jgi:hypothetical protein